MTPRQQLEREFNKQVRITVWGTASVIAVVVVLVTTVILSQIPQ